MPPLTRGPLPAGVYWRRRVFVLLLAATLVFVIASVLDGGSDAQDDEVPAAQQAGAEVEASQTITVADRKNGRKGKRTGGIQGPTYDPAVMVDPDGNCDPADIRITPLVETAVAGEPVTLGLSLQTVQADACYFRIGADKVTVKVTKGGREIWTSRECPDPVPDESVVVRRVIATVVPMTWTPYPQGRRGAECPGTDDWLMPGGFTITAAALGGEPAESAFELTSPAPETVTVTPDPKKKRKGDRDRDQLKGETAQEEAQGDDEGRQASDRSTDEPRR
jgi:hypothetical protein